MSGNKKTEAKKGHPSLTDEQLELAKQELAKKEQDRQNELNKRRTQCQQEIEAACEKYGMQLQAPVSRENILDFTAKLFNPNVGAVAASIQIIEKSEN